MHELSFSVKKSPDGSFQRGLGIFQYLCIFGTILGAALFVLPWNLARYDVWIYLFSSHDTLWLLACAIGTGWLISKLRRPFFISRGKFFDLTIEYPTITIALILFFVFLFTSIGSYYIYRSFPLSMDEFLAVFQSKIIMSGNWVSTIQSNWVEFARALQPVFMKVDFENQTWWPAYLPVNSALIACFSWLGLDNLSSPIMAIISIFFLYRISCILWPDDISPRIVSVIILTSSTQFLITSLTQYAMPAHLAFNMLWLLLFLKDRIFFHIIAAFIGAAAIGLHQPHNFLFFASPFLFYLLLQKRFIIFILYSSVLSLAFLYWIQWPQFFELFDTINTSAPLSSTKNTHSFLSRILRMLSARDQLEIVSWLMNIFRFFAWQHLLLIPLVWISIQQWREIPTIFKLIFISAAVSILPYILLMPVQGHGWGYRYLHGLLANFAIMAGLGWQILTANSTSNSKYKNILVGTTLIMLLVALPIRALQTSLFVKPFERSYHFISSLPADIVLVDTNSIWYGQDLIRNLPDLSNRPKILDLRRLSANQKKRLCSQFTTYAISYSDLSTFDIRPNTKTRKVDRYLEDHTRSLREEMESLGCNLTKSYDT